MYIHVLKSTCSSRAKITKSNVESIEKGTLQRKFKATSGDSRESMTPETLFLTKTNKRALVKTTNPLQHTKHNVLYKYNEINKL